MKKSIFLKNTLILLPLVIFLNLIILIIAYKIIYGINFDKCVDTVTSSAKLASDFFSVCDPDDVTDLQRNDETFNELCEMFDLAYVYAVKPDIENNSETYLSIGFGKEATEEARRTRYIGVEVQGKLNPQQIQAFNGNKNGTVRYESNQFGETVICYMPVYSRYYNSQKQDIIDRGIISIVGAEISLTAVMESFQQRFNIVVALTIILSVIIVCIVILLFHHQVARPVKLISGQMSGFLADKNQKFKRLEIKGEDEFAQMSIAFNRMADDIENYVQRISVLTKEKHIQEAELTIARKIQMGLLPSVSSRQGTVSINAYMLPARDVGGDLYDYQYLDNGNLFIAVADVSGKGISASLFMARAITLLQQYAKIGYSPARILAEYNNALADNNPNGMFITTFVGIYCPDTAQLTYTNGGHNNPYLVSDTLTELDNAHGIACGLFAGLEYEEVTIQLKSGDKIFLFTDGVNEAENKNSEFFTNARLEKALREYSTSEDNSLIVSVRKSLAEFTNGAEQSDDVTMLTLEILPQAYHRQITLNARTENWATLRDIINTADEIPNNVKMEICLMAEEIFVNICSYAYTDGEGEIEIRIDVAEKVDLTFIDRGKAFNPTENIADIDNYDFNSTIGGLGRFITFQMADSYSFVRKDGKNILKVSKSL